MGVLKTESESPLLADGSIRPGYREVKHVEQLDLLHPLRTPGLRMAFGVPRVGEIVVGSPHKRVFIIIPEEQEERAA